MTGPPRLSTSQILRRTVQYLGPCAGVFVSGIQAQAADAQLIWEVDMSFSQLRTGQYILENDLTIHDDKGSLCVDFKQFLRSIEAPIKVDTNSGNASGWYINEARVFDLNLAKHKLTADGVLSVIDSKDVRMTELGPCVTTNALQKWFPIDFKYSPRDSSLTLLPREPLPILARLDREEARKKINDYRSFNEKPLEDAPDIAYRLWSMPSFDVAINSNVSKSPGLPARTNFNYTVSTLNEIAHMTAETFLQSGEDGLPRSLRARLYRDDLRGNIFFKGSGITQFSIGDVASAGNGFIGGGAVGRGISVSTFPLQLADEYDRTSLRGDLPDGWEAELYRNDSLISYQPPSGDGRYEFSDVPVFFGQNKFRVVLYGPQGQRRDIERVIDTGQIVTPRGQWHMRASALQKNIDTIPLQRFKGLDEDRGSLRYDADVRTGILPSASIGLGTSSYEKNGERLWFGTLGLQTTVAQTALEVEGVKDKRSGWGVQSTVSRNFGNVGARVRYARYGGGFESERIDRFSPSRLEVSLSAPVRLAKNIVLPMALRGSYTESAFGNDLYNLNWSVAAAVRGASLSNALSYASVGSNESLRGSFGLNKRFDGTTVRAQAEYTVLPQAELASVRVGFDRSSNSYSDYGWHYSGDVAWNVAQKQGDIVASVTRRFNLLSVSAQASTNTRGGFGLGLSLTTSLGREPIFNRWRASARSFNSGGNVAVRVFEDMDGNAIFNDGDRPIVGARVQRSGGTGASSNGDGVLLVDGLSPYQPVKLQIDPDSISEGDLAQSNSANTSVIPRPGAVGRLDIPMVLAGGIEGEILLTQTGDTSAVPGVSVELLNASGDVIAATRTEFDGFFFFERVPVGNYRVRAAPAQLKALGISGNAPIDVAINRDKPYPSAIKLTLFKTGSAPTQVASLELQPMWGDREVMGDAPYIALAAVWGDAAPPAVQPQIQLAAMWNMDIESTPPKQSAAIVQTPVIIGRSASQRASITQLSPSPLTLAPSWYDEMSPTVPVPPPVRIEPAPVWREEIAVRRIYYSRPALFAAPSPSST
jgi:hypothetical protein